MKIDLKSIVNVKLTDYGKNVALYFYCQFKLTLVDAKKMLATKRNADGTYSFSFAEFMKTFGGFNSRNVLECFESIEIVPEKKESYIKILK